MSNARVPADAIGLPVTPRRSFLRGLLTLPLVGGGVTLIGQPTAHAVPVSTDLLDACAEWLSNEQVSLVVERHNSGDRDMHAPKIIGTPAEAFHYPLLGRASIDHPRFFRTDFDPPSNRAALVMSAVGCEWQGRR